MTYGEGRKMEHQQKNINFKNNVIWNSVGAIFFLACHWLITVLVVRLSKDYTNAGVLSLSTSIANIFAIIGVSLSLSARKIAGMSDLSFWARSLKFICSIFLSV